MGTVSQSRSPVTSAENAASAENLPQSIRRTRLRNGPMADLKKLCQPGLKNVVTSNSDVLILFVVP